MSEVPLYRGCSKLRSISAAPVVLPHQGLGRGRQKSIPRKAVVFKSGHRVRTWSVFVYPLEHSGVVVSCGNVYRTVKGGLAHKEAGRFCGCTMEDPRAR